MKDIKIHKAKPEHEVLYDELAALLKRHAGKLNALAEFSMPIQVHMAWCAAMAAEHDTETDGVQK